MNTHELKLPRKFRAAITAAALVSVLADHDDDDPALLAECLNFRIAVRNSEQEEALALACRIADLARPSGSLQNPHAIRAAQDLDLILAAAGLAICRVNETDVVPVLSKMEKILETA